MERIKSVEGLRGVATILVFLSHFGVLFYPAFYWADTTQRHIGVWEKIVGQSPIDFLMNGNSGVIIFLLITGYGTCKLYQLGHSRIKKYMMLRYFKLLLLSLVAAGMIFILARSGFVFYNEAATISGTPWLGNFEPEKICFRKCLLKNPLFSMSGYNSVLWTMQYIFISSVIAFILCYLLENTFKKFLVYILAGLILVNMNQPYYLCCVIGVSIANIQIPEYEIDSFIQLLLLVSGIYFGGYPSGVKPELFWYKYLPFFENASIYYHMIGMTALLISTVLNTKWKSFMEIKFLQWIGKYSIAIYIVHFGILVSFSSKFLIILNTKTDYNLIIMLDLVFTLGIVALAALVIDPLMKYMYSIIDKLYRMIVRGGTQTQT